MPSRPSRRPGTRRCRHRRPRPRCRRRGARDRREAERRPRTGGGIEIGPTGGSPTVACRRACRRIWAAGDCVECHHRISNSPVTIALGTHANKQGRVAGTNLTGGKATFSGVVGTAVTKICEHEVARTGLDEREARDAGFDFSTTTIEATTRAGYYPGTAPITVKVLVERETNRLLGAQIVGGEDAAKRIDVLATALWNEMTVDDDPAARSRLRATPVAGVGSGPDRGPPRRVGRIDIDCRPRPEVAASTHRVFACSWARSLSYIMRTSSMKLTRGFQPKTSWAFDASPISRSTSAGR